MANSGHIRLFNNPNEWNEWVENENNRADLTHTKININPSNNYNFPNFINFSSSNFQSQFTIINPNVLNINLNHCKFEKGCEFENIFFKSVNFNSISGLHAKFKKCKFKNCTFEGLRFSDSILFEECTFTQFVEFKNTNAYSLKIFNSIFNDGIRFSSNAMKESIEIHNNLDISIKEKSTESITVESCNSKNFLMYNIVCINNFEILTNTINLVRINKSKFDNDIIISGKNNINKVCLIKNCSCNGELKANRPSNINELFLYNDRKDEKNNIKNLTINEPTVAKIKLKNQNIKEQTTFKFDRIDDIDISDTFFTNFICIAQDVKYFHLHKSKFSSNADFASCSFVNSATFNYSIFQGEVNFNNAIFKNTCRFDNSTFYFAPYFHNAELHQDTKFSNVKFLDFKSGGAESSYRTLKLHMNKNQDFQAETNFFAMELKSRRMAKEDFISDKISFIYEYTSNYGLSLVRPLILLFTTHVFFTVIYYLLIVNSKSENFITFHNAINVFSIKNTLPILKPFYSIENKVIMQRLFNNGIPELSIQILSLIHSVIGALLIFLLFFVIRNKFKIK